MKTEEYEDIVKTITKFQGLSKDCAKMLVEKYSRYAFSHLFTNICILYIHCKKCQ